MNLTVVRRVSGSDQNYNMPFLRNEFKKDYRIPSDSVGLE